ncbi:MAG TPA: patatin-like phospholipase family protein [Candidatus Nitrosocosmicus sp.]
MFKEILTKNRNQMNGKEREKLSNNNKKAENNFDGVEQVVSEGLTVVLNASDLINDIDTTTDNIKNYSCSWKPRTDISLDNDSKDNQFFSFTAPYVKGNERYHVLKFELTITDKDGKTRNSPYKANVIVKRVHRAIVFQGGVSLGAYEAGVFQALVEKLEEQDVKKGLKDSRPLFDVVAGTSIGAMNGAIVVNDIKNYKSWQETSDHLLEFWEIQKSQYLTSADILDMNPLYHNWWEIMHDTGKASKEIASTLTESNPYWKTWSNMFMNFPFLDKDFPKDYFLDGWYIPATAESARRYYSAKQFLTFGAPNVASGIRPWSQFGKFFDWMDQSNYLPRPDNKHSIAYSLKNTLQRFVLDPIITKEEKGEPRFLLITIDVKTGDAVTFDSYEKKKDGHNTNKDILKQKDDDNPIKHYSEYGDAPNKYVIFYNKGIETDHILASGTFPGFFDYPKFEVENESLDYKKEHHIFWDGGFRSNTPLRELIQSHRDYYYKDDDDNSVPDLEVYIADLWPSELKEKPISFDMDFVENRMLNIMFGDKTDYDEQVANIVTDYVDLVKKFKSIAKQKGNVSDEEIDKILDGYATSISTVGKTRQYRELIQGRFRLTKVVRIDHKDDGHEVSNKIFDYSQNSIKKLIEDGIQDTNVQMDLQYAKDIVMGLVKRIGHQDGSGNEENDVDSQKLEYSINKIQEGLKIKNGYNNIMREVETLQNEVESIPEIQGRPHLKEKQALLISAVTQLKNTINSIKQENL